MDYDKEFTKQMIMLAESDPMNPEVTVDGLGTYDLETLKNSVRNQILNLAVSLEDGSARSFRNAKHDLDGGVIQAKVDAIVAAYEALEAKRRKGGLNARGIEKQ